MKIEIPDKLAEEIGIAGLNADEITFELTELAWRVMPNTTADEKSVNGVIVYAKEIKE